jgi:hypothetical protein
VGEGERNDLLPHYGPDASRSTTFDSVYLQSTSVSSLLHPPLLCVYSFVVVVVES